jgi:hypothetical protein
VLLVESQVQQRKIQIVVRSPMDMQKVALSVVAIQGVYREIAGIAGGIVHKLNTPEMGIVTNELNPRTLGAIDFFKAYAISRLDFKVPEDYNRVVPSSAQQHPRITSSGKSGVPGV